MKITDYGFLDLKIWNPVTNEIILDDIFPKEDAASLKGIWYLDCFEEPDIKDMELREGEWELFLKHFNKEETGRMWPYFAIEQFLLEYDDPDLQVIRHSSSIVSHGIGGTVVWYVVDKDVVVEKKDWSDIICKPDE